MADNDKTFQYYSSPLGLLLVENMFKRDEYTPEKGEPKKQYQALMAFDYDDDYRAFEEIILDAVADEWGEAAVAEAEKTLDGGTGKGTVQFGVFDGDFYAKKYDWPEKTAAAMAGKAVVSFTTIWNADGQKDEGGIEVVGPDLQIIDFANRKSVFSGCYGKVSYSLDPYLVNGQKGVKLYLNAFQLSPKEGEKLYEPRKGSSVFDAEAAPSGGRRSRRAG